MTQPNPDGGQGGGQGGGGQGGNAKAAKAPAAKVLDVVEFTRHDPVTGHDHTDLGVVVSVDESGGPLVVRPLAAFHHTDVDPGNVTVLSAADVSEG